MYPTDFPKLKEEQMTDVIHQRINNLIQPSLMSIVKTIETFTLNLN